MIEVEAKIANQPIAVLIYSGGSHSYIVLNFVERFHLKRSKHEESWMVQLATETKGRLMRLLKAV